MFYWSFTSLVHFWPPQFLILATPMQPMERNVTPSSNRHLNLTVKQARVPDSNWRRMSFVWTAAPRDFCTCAGYKWHLLTYLLTYLLTVDHPV